MRWLRKFLWYPYAFCCRVSPLIPFHIGEAQISPGVVMVTPQNWLTKLLGRIGGYPYSVMYLVDGELLVDTGFPWARHALQRYLERSGLTSTLRSVVTTHEHEDHFGNNDMVANVTGADVFAHPAAIGEISYPYEQAWYRDFLFGPVRAAPAKPAPSTIRTSARTLEIIHTPGHTPGHIVLYDPENKILFAGDLFLDIEADAQLSDADGPSWLASLDRINKLEIDQLLDGHGAVFDGQSAQAVLVEKADHLRSLKAAVTAEMAAGPRSVQAITRSINNSRAINKFSFGEGRMSILTGNSFSRSNLIRTFVRGQNETDSFRTALEDLYDTESV